MVKNVYTLEQHKNKELIKVGKIEESASFMMPIKVKSSQFEFTESEGSNDKKVLVVELDAIHEGVTANLNHYTQYGLREGLHSWTAPYPKPVLTHHNQYDGEPVGRIVKARELAAAESRAGRSGLRFTIEVSDKDAIEKVLDGRYSTVSIGSQTDKVTCNICHTDRTQEWCEHWKGETYDGIECHHVLGTIYGKEVSFVNVPADESAGAVSFEFKDPAFAESALLTSESAIYDIKNVGVNLYESYSPDQKEDYKKQFAHRFGGEQTKENESMKELAEFLEGKVGSSDKEKVKKYIESLEEKKEGAEKLLAVASTKTISLESQIEQAKTEKEDLVKENDDLKQAIHKNLAEKIVDMKIKLRKADAIAETKEQHLEKYTSKAKDVLESLHEELEAEMASFNKQQDPGSVSDPTGAKQTKENEQAMTAEESISLLGRAWAKA